MIIVFFACIIITLISVTIVWTQHLVIYPLFKTLKANQIKEFYTTYKNNIFLLTLPVHTMEAFTTFVSLIAFALQPQLSARDEKSFYLLGASLFILGIVQAITFMVIKPSLKALQSENATLHQYQHLLLWNFVRAILWSIRLVLIFSIIL